jgi:hypothetical protein
MNRARDSRDFLQRANRAIAAGKAAHPDAAQWYDGLASLADQISSATSREAGRFDLSALYRVILPADRPPLTPASPEVMRIELTALKLLGRIHDFRPMIELAMDTAEAADGPSSPAFRRYQSLWLKYLEESGDISSLLAALDDLAASPGLPPSRESLAIKTSALRYKARVLLDHGYVTEAASALADARSLLVNEPQFAGRLQEIESELQRLAAAPGVVAPPPADAAAPQATEAASPPPEDAPERPAPAAGAQ